MAYEALLLGMRPSAIVLNFTDLGDVPEGRPTHEDALNFVARMRKLRDRRVSDLPVFGVMAPSQIALPSSAELTRRFGDLRIATLATADPYKAIQQQLTPKPERGQVDSLRPQSPITTWLEQCAGHGQPAVLMLARVRLRELHGRPKSPRLALIRQQLREGDEVLVDEQQRIWIRLALQDELRAVKVALRVGSALTRSTDPGDAIVAVSLSGSRFSDSASQATADCESAAMQQHLEKLDGQMSILVGRWQFELPLEVAQSLC